MIRRTFALAIEFGEMGKKKIKQPVYGSQVIPKNRWARGSPHRTADCNRLLNMPCFAHIVKEIDTEFLAEKGMTLEDIRWLDERRIKWNCARCGFSWFNVVSDRTKNGCGCKHCFADIPSVTDHSLMSEKVAELYEKKPNPFASAPNGAFLQKLDAASRRVLSDLVCTSCGATFQRSVRCVTGVVCSGQTQVTKQEVCDSCLWTTKVMQKAAVHAKS